MRFKDSLLLILLILLSTLISLAGPDGKATMVFFYSPKCPHCQRAYPFIHSLEQKYKGKLKVIYVNVLDDTITFLKAVGIYNQSPAVPFIVVGDKEPIVGYSTREESGKVIEEAVKDCFKDTRCVLPDDLRNLLIDSGYIKKGSKKKKR